MAASETAPDTRHPAPEMPPTYPGKVLAVIPALNEEASLRALAKALEEAITRDNALREERMQRAGIKARERENRLMRDFAPGSRFRLKSRAPTKML